MKVPLSWLKEFVAFEATPEALAERLTFAGLEVAGVTRIGSDFKDIVVGEVVSVSPHPNADRLTLCDVATGRETVRVVCGAPNVHAGDKVPFAAIGAVFWLSMGFMTQTLTAFFHDRIVPLIIGG